MKIFLILAALILSPHVADAHPDKTCHAHGTHHHCK